MRAGYCTLYIYLLISFACTAAAQQHVFQSYNYNDGMAANSIRQIYQDSKGFIWMATWDGLCKYDGYRFTNYTTSNGLSHNLVNDIYEAPGNKMYIACNNGSIDYITDDEIIQHTPSRNIIINRFIHTKKGNLYAVSDRNGIFNFTNGTLVKPPQSQPHLTYYDLVEMNDSLLIAVSDSSLRILTTDLGLFAEWKKVPITFAECKIVKDSRNRIWMGYDGGLKLIAEKQTRGKPLVFDPLPAPFDLPLLRGTAILDILEDDKHTIWVATTNGLAKLNDDGTSQVFTEKNGLPSANISCLFQDREKNIWIGTPLGLVRLITTTDISIYTTENGLLSNQLGFVCLTPEGKMLTNSANGLNNIDPLNGKVGPSFISSTFFHGYGGNAQRRLLLNQYTITAWNDKTSSTSAPVYVNEDHSTIGFAVEDKSGRFFLGSYDLLSMYEHHTKIQLKKYNSYINGILYDKNGNLWVGSLNDGLYCYRFDSLTPAGANSLVLQKHFLPDKQIRCLFEDSKGSIWAGTRYDGLYRVSADTSAQPFQFEKANGLSSNWIRGVTEDQQGNIWVAFYLGIDKLVSDGAGYRVFNFSRINNFFANVNGITTDNTNTVWLATAMGLVSIKDGNMEKMAPLPVYIRSVTFADTAFKVNELQASAYRSLHYKHNQVQFEFSATGFINEKQVLYSYRLLGDNNTGWNSPSAVHTVSYASLQPGTYRFEVRMQGWNGEWGPVSSFSFTIKHPFWQTWWFKTLAALLLAAICFGVIRKRIAGIRQQASMKNKINETEMMALRAQMNPHFIFNCLNAIDNLIQTNQKEKATTYLARFARLIRAILESSKNNVVPFQKDLESLQLYLQMEEFRCNNKFSYVLTVDPELMQSDYKVPPLIVQPFVENAIHHGLLNKQSPDKRLTITIQLRDDYICYTITDNGVGRMQAQKIREFNKPEHISYGISITRERIGLYNQHSATEDITITDLQTGGEPSGTTVEIKLKAVIN